MKKEEKPMERRILTIPNLLSLFRLILIPVIIWLYWGESRYGLAAAALVLSGATDVIDGFVARHFHMVSNLGKILDPVADKLTQFSVLLCLFARFPMMLVPAILLAIKETIDGVVGIIVIRRTGSVYSAVWHGKLATCLLYLMMFIHIVWYTIPAAVSNLLIGICVAVMLLSLVLYCIRNIQILRGNGSDHAQNSTT